MTQSRKKFYVLAIMLAVCVLVTSGAMLGFAKADAAPQFSGGQIESTYVRRQTLDVPDGAFTSGGETYVAEHTVVFPDGRSSRASRVKLDTAGEYSLVYTAKEINAEKTVGFTVVNSAASQLNVVAGSATVTDTVTHPNTDFSGVKVTVNEANTVIQYTAIADLSKMSADTPLIDYMFIPDMAGSAEFSTVEMKLTDVTDSNNFITIAAKSQGATDRSYIVTAANGNELLGVTSAAQGAIPWGVPVAHSFYGDPYGGKYYSISYYYNVQTKQVMASPYSGASRGKVLVLDLDEPNKYVDADHVFGGFATNEVQISLRIPVLTARRGNLLIRSIAGADLSTGVYDDTTAPTIKVDFGSYVYDETNAANNTIPYGIVNKPYKIFDGYAYDDCDGILNSIDVEVYDANGARQSAASGSFTPKSAGQYTILYIAKDSSGNMAQKRVGVTVKAAYDTPITFTSNNPYNGATKQLGETVFIPSGAVTGGSGDTSYAVSVWLAEEEVQILGKDFERYFIPQKTGTYTIRYALSDYLGQSADWEDTVVIEGFTTPQISVQTIYPKYQVGIEYPLPVAQVAICESGVLTRTYVAATVVGASVSGKNFTATQAGTLTFTFSYQGQTETRTAEAIDVSTMSGSYLTRYFATENVTTDAQNYGIDFSTSSSDNEFSFINSIFADLLSFKFLAVPEKSDFTAVTFTLTDNVYVDRCVALRFVKTDYDYVELQVNGVFKARVFQVFDGIDLFSVSVKGGKVYLDDTAVATIDTYKNGEAFEGFLGGEVLLSGRFEGVTGNSAIQLRAIGNQNTTNASRDRVAPMIYITEEYSTKTYKFIGDVLEIFTAQAMDVLSGKTAVSVSVHKPDGTVEQFSDANEKRTITAQLYGDYRVTYTASDGSQSGELTYTYAVRDVVPPTLTLLTANKTQVRVGDTVTFALAKCTDDSGEECTVYCYLIGPDGIRTVVENGGRYTFSKRGVYRLVYYANDSYYNLAQVESFIEAK